MEEKLIKIITAIGNPNLNNVLKKYEEFNIIGNDILYLDGIFELFENNTDVNYLIIGDQFKGKYENIISKIKEINNKVKIITVIKKDYKEKNELYKIGISEIFYEDENIENIINYLKSKNIEYLNIELRNEIDNLKKMVLENKKQKNILKNICIGFVGTPGIGVTTSCILFAKALNKKNKILLIDFNFINSQIGFLYNKKINYSKINENNFDELIFSVDKNIDILIGLDELNNFKKINYTNLKKHINDLKNKYDYIFIDINICENFERKIELFNCLDYIFLLTGINDLEISKINNIINKIISDFKIKKEKLRWIFYRVNILEFLKIIFNKKNYFDIKKIGIIKNNIFVRKNIIKEKNYLNKILIRKIIKKI